MVAEYILTFQDDLSKFLEAAPIQKQEAETLANKFVTEIICRQGIPEQLLTDQGANFVSNVFKNVCKLFKKLRKYK